MEGKRFQNRGDNKLLLTDRKKGGTEETTVPIGNSVGNEKG